MFLDNSTGIVYDYDPHGAGRTNVIQNAAMANAPGAWHCVSCNWKRVTDVNDRMLRTIGIGQGPMETTSPKCAPRVVSQIPTSSSAATY